MAGPGSRKKRAWVRRVRSNIYRRDGGRCVWCDRHLDMRDATLDHVTPKSAGGGNTQQNLVLACSPCNFSRGNRPAWAFLVERVGR
jgi:5-methylcytosine-specific restriction endonuclease McrA